MKIKRILLTLVLGLIGIVAFSQSDLIEWDNLTRCTYTVRYTITDGTNTYTNLTATLAGGNNGTVTYPSSGFYLTKLEIKENSVGMYYDIPIGYSDNNDVDCYECTNDAIVHSDGGSHPMNLEIECN